MDTLPLLPELPRDRIRRVLTAAAGNELEYGKFASSQSSAALAVNGFGWFLERPEQLPAFPCLASCDWPATRVDIERQMRFPWRGGRHPWLDAAVETEAYLVGVESKRYEPFRDRKVAKLSEAYDRDVWGERMEPWGSMRDFLRANPRHYRYLDAAQLVKHAFGLVTQGRRRDKKPVLLYLFAEPSDAGEPSRFLAHREEIADFADRVKEARVVFAACSWAEWLATFTGRSAQHAARVRSAFDIA